MSTSAQASLAARLLHAFSVVVAASMISFALLRFAPGDALSGDTSQRSRGAVARDVLRARSGVHAPLATQYLAFVRQLARGDLGHSLVDGRPVAITLRSALGDTLLLTGSGITAAIAIGLIVGTAQGWSPGSRWSRVAGEMFTALYAVPEFVLAIGLLAALAYGTGWFPVGGASDPVISLTGTRAERYADVARHLVVPALTLACGWGAMISKQQRVALLQTTQMDFVRTARAKGVSEGRVFRRHAMLPSLSAVVATVGLMLPVLVGGAVVVEIVFAWPGMGSLMLHAVAQRDTPVVSGAVLLVATGVSLSSIFVEQVVRWIDPRQR